ncbi:ER lumen protein-retaining receptor [Paramicrosporidium saccamoebae]|uniref:ER lumen protein-retaining receptor n=1 Tax=Paramicrosporidium saccamoebae TaxID=1246581 RepID=A0A2H9TQX3_9FUNG|nr:ER lumen protein-retaining receptor [Paramicrosporidium saccamoebae]
MTTPSGSFNLFRLFGDLLHVASIFLLWTKIHKTRSCAGLSLKSQILFLSVYMTRYLDLFVFIFHRIDLYHLYNFVMKCLFIGSQAAVIYYMWFRYRPTYNAKLDTVRPEFIVLPCLVLSFFFFEADPRANSLYYVREYFWTFSILLESVAILPQMFLLSNTGEAESITTHYLLCLGLYRAFYLLNWIWRFIFYRSPEAVVVLAGILQTALYSDFFYIYYKRVFSGRAFKLPI